MKYLKYFESERQFREVDLQEIWDNVHTYSNDIINGRVYMDNWFCDKILEPLLLDKEIEFKRAIHPADKEVIYGHAGRVKSVRLQVYEGIKSVIVSLYSNNKFEYILGPIGNAKNKPLIIKIYDSEPLEIENKLDLLKNADKYNL